MPAANFYMGRCRYVFLLPASCHSTFPVISAIVIDVFPLALFICKTAEIINSLCQRFKERSLSSHEEKLRLVGF